MTIDVEAVYIDIESLYLFKMGVRKEGAKTSHGGRRSSFRGLSATDRKVTRKHGDSFLFRPARINSKTAPFSFVTSIRPSVRPHVSARLPVARFSQNLTLGAGTVMKICPAMPSLV